MKSLLMGVLMLGVSATAAVADDWTNTPLVQPVSGPDGPAAIWVSSPGFLGSTRQVTGAVCQNLTTGVITPAPPPCGAGQLPIYNTSPPSPVTNVSIFQAIPTSNVGIDVSGFYADPLSPMGVSTFDGRIGLSAFASSATVGALSSSLSSLNISFNQLQGQVANQAFDLAGLHSALIDLSHHSDRGVAMALAMPSVDLQPDEHFAVAGDWGTFGGENAFAISAAMRLDNQISLTGGVSKSLNGGELGGHAGFRIGW